MTHLSVESWVQAGRWGWCFPCLKKWHRRVYSRKSYCSISLGKLMELSLRANLHRLHLCVKSSVPLLFLNFISSPQFEFCVVWRKMAETFGYSPHLQYAVVLGSTYGEEGKKSENERSYGGAWISFYHSRPCGIINLAKWGFNDQQSQLQVTLILSEQCWTLSHGGFFF